MNGNIKKGTGSRKMVIADFGNEGSGIYEAQKEIDLSIFHRDFKRAFRQLTKRQQQIIYFIYFLGLTGEEIGEVLGISYQAVFSTRDIALEKLRMRLSKHKDLLSYFD